MPPGAGMETRYGLNHAWNSRLRLCDSSTRNASGSQPGSCPRVPVRYSDQGSYGDGQSASAVGRTCTTTALWLSRSARSSSSRYSACWAATRSGLVWDALLGQSMLTTDEIHMARNCRFGVAGSVVQLVLEVLVALAVSGAAFAGAAATRLPSRVVISPAAARRVGFMRCVPPLGLPCDERGTLGKIRRRLSTAGRKFSQSGRYRKGSWLTIPVAG